MESRDEFDADCLFCQWIRAGETVEIHGTVVAFHDGHPVTQGHLLLVPRRHIADGFSMTAQEMRDTQALVRVLVDQIVKNDPSVTGFNIGMNVGQSAGQTVFHAHIHLIPRREGDCENPKGGVRGVIDGKRGY